MWVGKMLIDLGGLGILVASFFDDFSIAQIRMLLSKIAEVEKFLHHSHVLAGTIFIVIC